MSKSPRVESTGAPAPSPASRRLVGLEHAMCITEEHVPFHVVGVLRVDGDLPAASVRRALDTLQQRHPLLRARILPEAKGYAFHFDASGPIPLEVGERTQPDAWIAAAQGELHGRLDWTAGPLARCRYLVDGRGGDLILSIHHTIVDASSGEHLIGELLALCAGRTPDEPGDSEQEGRLPPTALYPDAYRGLGFARALAAFMGGQMADETAFRWRSRGVRTPPIAATARCCLLPIRFSPALTERLVQASRRRHLTLNAILSAGLMAAVQRHLYPMQRVPARVPLRHIVFADLRSRLRTTLPEAMLGCLLTMFRFTVLVEREGGLWALAQDIQKKTFDAARSGERYLAYSMSPKMMAAIFRFRAFRMGATALSYSGPVTLPTDYGSFELKSVHAFPGNMPEGPEYSALVRLFRGELWLDMLYLDSDMGEDTARRIAQDMQTMLEGAAC